VAGWVFYSDWGFAVAFGSDLSLLTQHPYPYSLPIPIRAACKVLHVVTVPAVATSTTYHHPPTASQRAWERDRRLHTVALAALAPALAAAASQAAMRAQRVVAAMLLDGCALAQLQQLHATTLADNDGQTLVKPWSTNPGP